MDKSIEKIGRRRAERKAEPKMHSARDAAPRQARTLCRKAQRVEGTVKNRLLWEE